MACRSTKSLTEPGTASLRFEFAIFEFEITRKGGRPSQIHEIPTYPAPCPFLALPGMKKRPPSP